MKHMPKTTYIHETNRTIYGCTCGYTAPNFEVAVQHLARHPIASEWVAYPDGVPTPTRTMRLLGRG